MVQRRLRLVSMGNPHAMIVACPSLTFAFTLLLISHAIVSAFCLHFLLVLLAYSYLMFLHFIVIAKCMQPYSIFLVVREIHCIPSSTHAGKVLWRFCWPKALCRRVKCKNEGNHLYRMWGRLVYWRRWKNWGVANFTNVIVAAYLTYFECFIVYRNTRRPPYVSKRLITAAFEQFHNIDRRVSIIPT